MRKNLKLINIICTLILLLSLHFDLSFFNSPSDNRKINISESLSTITIEEYSTMYMTKFNEKEIPLNQESLEIKLILENYEENELGFSIQAIKIIEQEKVSFRCDIIALVDSEMKFIPESAFINQITVLNDNITFQEAVSGCNITESDNTVSFIARGILKVSEKNAQKQAIDLKVYEKYIGEDEYYRLITFDGECKLDKDV
ncbi:MAG: hypothetical protein VB095_00800 [Anaerovorax sp.]|nr:hypothetical protein [Anaerovorax sp.]